MEQIRKQDQVVEVDKFAEYIDNYNNAFETEENFSILKEGSAVGSGENNQADKNLIRGKKEKVNVGKMKKSEDLQIENSNF